MLKDLAPQWLPGNGSYRGKSLILVTKGIRGLVRTVVSTGWWGPGVVDH